MKPKVKLTGVDSNVFNLIGLCTKSLKENNQDKEAMELIKRVFHAKDYQDALRIMGEYCDIS